VTGESEVEGWFAACWRCDGRELKDAPVYN
jgi:hypothetical protein